MKIVGLAFYFSAALAFNFQPNDECPHDKEV